MNTKDLDSIITSLAEVLGGFSQSSVIGGGIALLLYRHYLVSAHSTDYPQPAATIDFDMLVPRELPQTQESLGSRLTQAGFVRETRSLETPPSSITTTSGAKLHVVAPAPWMFHKALTFPRRHSKAKRAKDLYGIWYLGTQLGPLSKQSLAELSQLGDRKPNTWSTRALRNISNWVSDAAADDWKLLEAQDPAQRLTEDLFRRFVEEDFIL